MMRGVIEYRKGTKTYMFRLIGNQVGRAKWLVLLYILQYVRVLSASLIHTDLNENGR